MVAPPKGEDAPLIKLGLHVRRWERCQCHCHRNQPIASVGVQCETADDSRATPCCHAASAQNVWRPAFDKGLDDWVRSSPVASPPWGEEAYQSLSWRPNPHKSRRRWQLRQAHYHRLSPCQYHLPHRRYPRGRCRMGPALIHYKGDKSH